MNVLLLSLALRVVATGAEVIVEVTIKETITVASGISLGPIPDRSISLVIIPFK
jgi:hypothetical protein